MTRQTGENISFSDEGKVTTVLVNSVTATTIVPAITDANSRIAMRIDMESGTSDREVYIRVYPAAQDNIKQGILLTRRFSGDDSALNNSIELPLGRYIGEISAICVLGSVRLHITEF